MYKRLWNQTTKVASQHTARALKRITDTCPSPTPKMRLNVAEVGESPASVPLVVVAVAEGALTASSDRADAMKFSHAEIVSDGKTKVDVAEPDPYNIADSPGSMFLNPSINDESSPPVTETEPFEEVVTSPVELLPSMNSRKKTKA